MNVVYPGPSVGGNTETHPKLADMVIAALAPALPERVAAAEGGTACNFLFGGVHPKTGDYYANYHLEGGGWGAKSYDDGNDAHHRQERQLPQHAGRDLRDALPAAHGRVLA